MSHVKHETVCITSWKEQEVKKLWGQIRDEGVLVTEIYKLKSNSYWTFYVLPSGSKAGWAEAKFHLDFIEQIKGMIKEFDYEDGSNPFDYAVAEYGDFEG